MDKKINIAFISDENYIQHVAVAISSLLENNLNIVKNIYIVHNVDDETLFTLLINFTLEKYKINILLLKIETNEIKKFNLSHHLTMATYFRLFFSEIIPESVDELLFLDSDIVVQGSLKEIQNLEFENNCFLYAVNHKYTKNDIARLRNFNYLSNKYFNAGILYINLKQWRDQNVVVLFQEILKKYNDKILWADQDVLNIAFQDAWCELDFQYNAFGLEIKDDTKDYKIIHYAGSSKPWHYRNKHPYKNLYWKYLKTTPFKRYFSEDLTVINVIKWMIPKSIKEYIKGKK